LGARALARSELGHAFSEPLVRDPEWRIYNHAAQTDDLVNAGGKLSIGQWADASPANRELMLTRSLMIDAPMLRRIGDELGSLLEAKILDGGRVRPNMVSDLTCAATARIFNLPPVQPETENETMALDEVMADPVVADLVARYLKLAERVERNYDELRESLAK